MGDYVAVMKSSSLEPGKGQIVKVNGKRLAVFKEGNELYCVDDFCPHAGASLGQGTVMKGVVYCPWHQWGFNGKSGKCITGSIWHVESFKVREINGMIEIDPTPIKDNETSE